MQSNMTHLRLSSNTDRYQHGYHQSPFGGAGIGMVQQVPMEILEDNVEMVYNLHPFVDVEEWKAVMYSLLHFPLSPDAALHQYSEEQSLFSPEEDQYAATHCASSPNLQSALDNKGRCAVACSSPMWCTEWEPFSERPDYCDWTQMGSQYSDWCMTEEFLLDQDDAQQDDGLRLKDYQTLTSPVNLDQSVPSSCPARDTRSLQELTEAEEEKLLDSHSTPAKSGQKQPLTTPEKPPSKRIADLSASPGRLLFQSFVESLESTIKEVHTWLDSTATETAIKEVYTWLDSTATDDG